MPHLCRLISINKGDSFRQQKYLIDRIAPIQHISREQHE